MTGPEHYREAERLLGESLVTLEGHEVFNVAAISAAAVHGTLALAAATALNIKTPGLTTAEYDAWHEVAGTESAPVSP